MRLKLTLIPLQPNTQVPINYNYPVSAAIYKILALASPEYAGWLHEKGYPNQENRLLKLFTFSDLHIPQARRVKNTLQAGNNRPWEIFIGSPVEEDFVQHFVLGLFEKQKLEIAGIGATGHFLVESVETLKPPVFRKQMTAIALSPIVVSTMREHNGKLQPYYYRATDPEVGEAMRATVLSKYFALHGEACPDPQLQVALDIDYFHRRKGNVSRLVAIKEGSEQETRVKGFVMPFKISGNPELLRVAWECGIGNKTSLGFGMIDLR